MIGFPSKPLAFVDIETTGGSPQGGGIIEIAIITVENGEIQERWTSLINPERSLPYIITSITGITPEELEYAPTFASLASEIYEKLRGKLFVAHNARFDYSFIKNELKLNDIIYNAKTLCTVKLSRSLFPRYKRHNLDVLIERFNLSCKNRHRALDDAQAMIDFMRAAEEKIGSQKIEKTIQLLLNAPALPSSIDKKVIDELPEATGVYIFKEKTGRPIYIGKSVNIRKRILSHFSSDHQSTKELKIKEAICDIEYKLTEGELSALLLESELIKQHLPLYNKKLRKLSSQTVLYTTENADGYLKVEYKRGDVITEDDLKHIYGVFNSVRSAQRHVELIAKEHRLCPVKLGLEKGKTGKACFSYQLSQCEGACTEEMTAIKYNLKLTKALFKLKHQTWPFQGPIGIQEGDQEKSQIHVIHQWSYIGSANSQEELQDILEFHQKPDFEFDTYRIIRGYLRKKTSKNIKVIALGEKLK